MAGVYFSGTGNTDIVSTNLFMIWIRMRVVSVSNTNLQYKRLTTRQKPSSEKPSSVIRQ